MTPKKNIGERAVDGLDEENKIDEREVKILNEIITINPNNFHSGGNVVHYRSMKILKKLSKNSSETTKLPTPDIQEALRLTKSTLFGIEQFEILLDPELMETNKHETSTFRVKYQRRLFSVVTLEYSVSFSPDYHRRTSARKPCMPKSDAVEVSVFMCTNILQTFEKDKNKELAAAKAKNIELQRKKEDLTKKTGELRRENEELQKRNDELRAL
ncbi:hypothetical protein DAPPUDRAFT_330869 [Daphnia pulex]|uniref:Uncharacterized protein n=1 Tax=Daphnia pulex TaxID=6669 RepID=E9HKW2_DAPPU|nr:hypothetical protein DAPPUDRAFT_330869 [Daphnia pulex]|eukprot:EFX67628.1 hypothetical protein DAPPUDRAFT_330869 [Daphnia pulex]